MNAETKLACLSLIVIVLIGFSNVLEANDAGAESSEKECSPGLEGDWYIDEDPIGVLPDKLPTGGKKKVKIKKVKKDGKDLEKPDDGFSDNWKDADWENVGDDGECFIKGTVSYDGCEHDATIQKPSDNDIELTVNKHNNDGSAACTAHKAAKPNSHKNVDHLGSAHGSGP